jgi:transposase
VLVASRKDHGVTVIGPVADDPSWQARARDDFDKARFARRDCTPCPLRSRCTRSKRETRIVGLQAREHHEALQAARKRQDTSEFREAYATRAGIEATHGQAVRRCGSRRCRYIGLTKTHLQNIITAGAFNLVRIADWVNGIPATQTGCSWFAALQKAA